MLFLPLLSGCAWVSEQDLASAEDHDGDGFVASQLGGPDCDDASAAVNPAAVESWYDGRDADCAGDDDYDRDGDGYVPQNYAGIATEGVAGSGSLPGGDCDDTSTGIHPGAEDLCAGGIDEDCDGEEDEAGAADARTWYPDEDEDGWGDETGAATACDPPQGAAEVPGDCDDADGDVNPDVPETCDGIDDDCDGSVDEDDAVDATPWYTDADGDTWGDAVTAVYACEAPAGLVADGTDCDDADAAVNAGATETCDGRDDDCDGTVDEDDAADAGTWYPDGDGDGHGYGPGTPACVSPSGYVPNADDCDDTDATSFPGGTEVCGGGDEDCDTDVDEPEAADAATWYADTDGDRFGDAGAPTIACTQPTAHVADATDCDDTDVTAFPGGTEVCGGGDEDCDTLVDEAEATDAPTWYLDDDADGYGTSSSTVACAVPAGHASVDGDCDDTDADASPAGTEVCDGDDDDCDGDTDEADAADATTWYSDADGDGWGDGFDSGAAGVTACAQPSGHVANNADCDDTSASSQTAFWYYVDADGDGFGDPDTTTRVASCDASLAGYAQQDDDDCDDADASVNPDGAESADCDGIDSDCDGSVDFGFSVPSDYATLQAAVNAATDGDHLCVGAGTWTENVTVSSALVMEGYGSDQTVLDGGGTGRALYVTGVSGILEVRGMTISGGSHTSGAGIYAYQSEVLLEDLVIEGNSCSGSSCNGTGIYVYGAPATLSGVEVRDNAAATTGTTSGHGILLYGASAGTDLMTLQNVRITGNDALGGTSAHGALMFRSCEVEATNIIVAGNSSASSDASAAIYSAGISIQDATGLLGNVSIHRNDADAGTGTVSGIGLYSGDAGDDMDAVNVALTENTGSGGTVSAAWYGVGTVTPLFTDTWGNDGTPFGGSIPDPAGANGNIRADPEYTSDASADPADWDFSLRSTSDLIDAGDPSVPEDGTRSDIGAYGGPGGDDW